MKNLLETMRNLIKVLPNKDKTICNNYLDKRDFHSILEIVESYIYIYKEKQKDFDDISDRYIESLMMLQDILSSYISSIEILDEDYYDEY